LVTHNPEVATETERVIRLRDGHVTKETDEDSAAMLRHKDFSAIEALQRQMEKWSQLVK